MSSEWITIKYTVKPIFGYMILGIVATALRLLKEGLRKNNIAIDDDDGGGGGGGGDNIAVLL